QARRPAAGSAIHELDLGMLIHSDTGQFAVVLGEVDGHDDHIVIVAALGGQTGRPVLEVAEDALDRGRPLLAANTDTLGDPDALARLEGEQQRGKLRRNRPRGGAKCWAGHSTSPPRPGVPRTRAIRPVRASSTMP